MRSLVSHGTICLRAISDAAIKFDSTDPTGVGRRQIAILCRFEPAVLTHFETLIDISDIDGF